MLDKWEIDLIYRRFKGRENLMLIYLCEKYVFAIVSQLIPQLPIAQITRDEIEKIVNTEEAAANLAALVSARCIVNKDSATEIKVIEAIGNEVADLTTKDMLEQEIRRIIQEMKEEDEQVKAEEKAEEIVKKATRKDLFDILDEPVAKAKTEVEKTEVETTEEVKGVVRKTTFSSLSDLLDEES